MSFIFVEDDWGMRLGFHVTLSDPVHTLKQMIEETDGMPIARQELKYQGSELQDEYSLESYLISNNGIIQFSSHTLFVQTSTGRTLSFYIDFDAPVSQLQEMVYDKERLPVGKQRLVFSGKILDPLRSLSSYGIVKESTIHLILRLRGGGFTLAYAVVLHSWPGNMNHQGIKGLELVHGQVVVITSEFSDDWYLGRVPNGTETRVLPRGHVRIINNVTIRQYVEQPLLRWFPRRIRSSILTPRPHNDTHQVPKLNFTPPPEETTEHPLPMFDYPEAAPIRFDQRYNGDRIEITLQYERLVKPGEQPRIKVDFKTSSRRRIAAVHLRIIAHDNVVVDVQPRSREIGPERQSEVITTKDYEKKRQWKAGGGFHHMAGVTVEGGGENTGSYSTTESGTRSSTATIIGQSMRTLTDDDTADWNLKEAKTSYGGDGIKGYDEGDGLSFSLLEMPYRFSYECWVTLVDSDGSERNYYKNSFGFWGKYEFRREY